MRKEKKTGTKLSPEKKNQAELFAALEVLEKEKGIPKDYMLEKIGQALLTAYRRDNPGAPENVVFEPDEKKKTFRLYARKTVVDDIFEPYEEMTLEEAREMFPNAEMGSVLNVEIKTMDFGRIAAQTAKQVIIQGIREAEQGALYQRFTANEHEILPAVVSRVDPRNGNLILEMESMRQSNGEKTEAVLTASEQIRGEVLSEGDRIRVYVVEVKTDRGRPRVLISRTHPGLVKRLFELNVPEISDGLVEIRSISREGGSRTKMAVWSANSNIDPVGACVGPRGERVNAVVNELRGEKIDIVRYSDDVAQFVGAALQPASVLRVDVAADGKSCRAVVPDDQLSLAIGKEGQNARLAVRLTGIKIDIKSKTQDAADPLPEDYSVPAVTEAAEAVEAVEAPVAAQTAEPEKTAEKTADLDGLVDDIFNA